VDIGENQPLTEIIADTETIFRIRMCFERRKQKLHIFVSLEIRQATN
jgi:hypothetical protein